MRIALAGYGQLLGICTLAMDKFPTKWVNSPANSRKRLMPGPYQKITSIDLQARYDMISLSLPPRGTRRTEWKLSSTVFYTG